MRVLMRALLCALLICCVLLPVQAEGSYPACQGIVSDWAGVIGGQTAQDLDTLSTRLSDQTGGRLYVAVRHFLGGAEARAYADGLFTAWNLGEQDALLLLVIGEETYALHLGDQARRLIPACEVLKVGNHGEDDATSVALVEAVQPRLAVISTNTVEEPDTPSDRVMKLLTRAGAQIWQTQDAEAGVMVTVSGGAAAAEYAATPVLPAPDEGVMIVAKGEDDTIRLRNTSGKAIDLTD